MNDRNAFLFPGCDEQRDTIAASLVVLVYFFSLQGNEDKTVYAVSGIDWGYFRDVHLSKKK